MSPCSRLMAPSQLPASHLSPVTKAVALGRQPFILGICSQSVVCGRNREKTMKEMVGVIQRSCSYSLSFRCSSLRENGHYDSCYTDEMKTERIRHSLKFAEETSIYSIVGTQVFGCESACIRICIPTFLKFSNSPLWTLIFIKTKQKQTIQILAIEIEMHL